ncbi:uncharacterized protein B0I36DRAFT_377272 [Microdochium trichocladiopsis]|uniref:NAD(P)-binding protein n=1 Tax=Microdochium trichocladiopsis TaxID=1682393 RepID=A0A9P8XWF8_9PEZI|nr:uncharacterized protein B0I36DRAFT_377272 [Microdochium trichocladiopsis]KAH7021409.1 hypothetical protein B0I36DRAFT_377272 [Microdochium trichocladiopsis]
MTRRKDSLPDLSGKTYIVTGATSGMGFTTAARLAQHGAHVYLCARSQAKGDASAAKIKTQYPGAKLSILTMDHADLATIVAAARHFLSQEAKLHGLVNNAGIMATPYAITKDGYEEQWQTNYLAHWVFTRHLLPVLKSTAAAERQTPGAVRIVNLTSVGHFNAPTGGINFEDTSLGKASAGLARYGQSKLANVLHAKVLHEQQCGQEIWVSAVHPGLVKTNLGERATSFPAPLVLLVKCYSALGGARDADSGSFTSLFCIAGSQFRREQSGTYFQPVAVAGNESAYAKDMELARKLEAWTEKEMRKGGWVA